MYLITTVIASGNYTLNKGNFEQFLLPLLLINFMIKIAHTIFPINFAVNSFLYIVIIYKAVRKRVEVVH